LANQAKNIQLDNIKEVSLDLKGEENELKVLENSLNFMLLNIKTSQFEIFSSLEKISNLNTKLNQSNLRLEDTVTERTEKLRESLNKTEAMLSNIELAIFTLDSTGKVLVPVSKYSHELFGKNIIGENGLKLLFFHLKDDSLEKKELLLAWKSLFGGENLDFLIHLGNFPKKVIHPDEKKKQGRVLEMHYEPLFNKGGKVDKLMVIVEDVTELDHERRQIRETGQNYNIIMDIMPIEDKESLSKWIAEFIKLGVFTLEKFVASGGEDLSQDQMSEGLNEVFQLTTKGDLQSLNCFKEVISNIKDELKSINRNNKQETYLMSVKTISRIIESLMRHADALNILHKSNLGPKVQYALPENFEISIKEKVLDLERLMVNLLEYVFLVRNVNDLDKDKISNAPKKAMLYAEFDNIINLIMNRSLLISYLFNVVGNSNAYESFNTLSELLKQMPSKNKLTEWALVNHLIEPYKQILEVTKKI
jgi:rubrerythrin